MGSLPSLFRTLKPVANATNELSKLTISAAENIAAQKWELAKADWLKIIEKQPADSQKAFDAFKKVARWQEAAVFGQKVIELDPKKTLSWLQQSPVLVLAGDPEAYRAYCERMLKQFGDNPNDSSATHTIKACLLQPGMIDVARLPVAAFLKPLEDGTSPEGTRHFRWGLRGLLALRSDDAESAVKYITQSEELKPTNISRAMNLSVLALAHHNLQQAEQAKTALQQAAEIIKSFKISPGQAPSHDQLIAEILFAEAEAKIGKIPSSDRSKEFWGTRAGTAGLLR